MSNTDRLCDRLAAMGVEFPNGRPTKAQCLRTGEIYQTFLCLEHLHGRNRYQLDTRVSPVLDGRLCGEIILEAPVKILAVADLSLRIDDVNTLYVGRS